MLEKWLCLIVGKEEMINMEDKENKDLKNAYEKIREFSASEEEIELYYSRVLAETNYKDDMSYMLKKGKKERNIEIAKNLLKLNIDIDIIVKSTGLTKEEIEELSNN